MTKRNFIVVIEKDPETGLYIGVVPGFTGAHSQGKTVDELMKNMKEVVELCLESKKEEKELPLVVGIQQLEVTA